MKFKVGAKVIVKQVTTGGNFEIGDVVEVCQIGDDDGYDNECYGAISPHDGYKWYLGEDEVGPATNADRIRAMNDEELAKFFDDLLGWTSDGYEEHLNWLRQPAEED